ncbi:MAG: hypothetical protein ACR2JZ_05760, partial [Candidatus Limnocylindrales bacterium]
PKVSKGLLDERRPLKRPLVERAVQPLHGAFRVVDRVALLGQDCAKLLSRRVRGWALTCYRPQPADGSAR